MPLKKKPIKKSIKAKKVTAKAKSQSEKKKTPPKLMATKKSGKKKAAPKVSGGNIFWKVLEMRRKEREARNNIEHGNENKDPRIVYNDKHARFARYAGPRRRAA